MRFSVSLVEVPTDLQNRHPESATRLFERSPRVPVNVSCASTELTVLQARKFEKFAHPGAADGVRCDDARAGRSRDERVDGLTIMLALLLSALTVDYEIITASGTDAGPAVIYKTVLPNASIEIATPPAYGYEAKVDNGARALRAFGPLGGNPCGVLSTTSKTAEAHACRWAVNAGPYDTKTHQCPSVFISNGIVQGNGSWAVQFGVTGNGSWVIGTIDATTAKELDVRESVPRLWLACPQWGERRRDGRRGRASNDDRHNRRWHAAHLGSGRLRAQLLRVQASRAHAARDGRPSHLARRPACDQPRWRRLVDDR